MESVKKYRRIMVQVDLLLPVDIRNKMQTIIKRYNITLEDFWTQIIEKHYNITGGDRKQVDYERQRLLSASGTKPELSKETVQITGKEMGMHAH